VKIGEVHIFRFGPFDLDPPPDLLTRPNRWHGGCYARSARTHPRRSSAPARMLHATHREAVRRSGACGRGPGRQRPPRGLSAGKIC
jgi:hypothetical protein